MKEEREHLDRLVEDADDAVGLFSEVRKHERERSVCAAFLRCLGVQFTADELASSADEPPDVVFRTARFEITEVLDPRRRRHNEWKAKLERRRRVKAVAELLEPYHAPSLLSYSAVVDRVGDALLEKSNRYGQAVCGMLDALVYVNLQDTILAPDSTLPVLTALGQQGWRSVSLLIPLHGHVLYAAQSAPAFLRHLLCQAKSEWGRPDGLFDL